MNATAALLIYRNARLFDWRAIDWFPFAPEVTAVRCRTRSYLLVKRLIDLPVALLLIGLLAPLMLGVAAAVRLTSPGPVLFRQRRLGRDGRPFDCLKFRSMRTDAEEVLQRDPAIRELYIANGYKLPGHGDPRVTRIGRFLRRSSLDELPQLINVLRGEMSLVGPRPIVPTELAEYGIRADDFVAALPGITGRWQVSGRSSIQYPFRAHLELEYIYRWSPLLDLRILLLTLPAVLGRTGAY